MRILKYAEVINIGTNTAFSVLELAIQMGGEYNHVASRQGEARHTLADITKAKTLLGWEPKKNLLDYLQNKEYEK